MHTRTTALTLVYDYDCEAHTHLVRALLLHDRLDH